MIGNLVHSSPNIKKEVLLAGALQPVIRLLRYHSTSGLIVIAMQIHHIMLELQIKMFIT